jgi:prophage antirepressor-like protein
MQNAVAVRQEVFDNMQLSVIEHGGEEWFTAKDIAKALDYSNGRKVHNVYYQYADEFENLSTVLELRAGDGKVRKHRVFNLQGCQLIGFFARTPRGKLFRKWASHMLAHGIHKMKAHILALEENKQLAHLSWELIDLRDEVKELTAALKRERAKTISLPSPEPKPLPPLTKDDMILMNYLELKKLYEFGYEHGLTETHGMETFSPGYLVRVINRDAAVPKLKLEMNLPVTISGYNLVGLNG